MVTRVGRVDLDLLHRSRGEEARGGGDEGDLAAVGQAGADADHVLLRDADVDEPVGEPLLERSELGRPDGVVDDGDDAVVGRCQVGQGGHPGIAAVVQLGSARGADPVVVTMPPARSKARQRLGHLVGGRHLVVPGDVVLHERDRVALVGAGDHRGRPSRGGRYRLEGVQECRVVVAVDLDDVEAEGGQLVGERLEVVGVGDPGALLQAVAVDHDAQVLQPVVAGCHQRLPVRAFLQLTVTDHDERTARRPVELARERGAHGDRQPVAERVRCWPRRPRSWSWPDGR